MEMILNLVILQSKAFKNTPNPLSSLSHSNLLPVSVFMSVFMNVFSGDDGTGLCVGETE